MVRRSTGIWPTVSFGGNVVRDVVQVGQGFGVSAYYLDEGARDCIVECNVSVGVVWLTHNHIVQRHDPRQRVHRGTGHGAVVSIVRRIRFRAQYAFAPGKITIIQPNGIKSWKGNVIFRNGLSQSELPQPFTIDDGMPPVPTPGARLNQRKLCEWPSRRHSTAK